MAFSAQTMAEMEAGRQAVAAAEARLRAKQENDAALAAASEAKEIVAEVEFAPPIKKGKK